MDAYQLERIYQLEQRKEDMNIKRINELGKVIEDAQKKIDIIEGRLLENSDKDKQDFMIDMLFMNVERRDKCLKELDNLKQ